MNCKICNNEASNNDLRLGVCWECAEAESIIGEGLDMDDKGYNGPPADYPMDKLRFLIQKGWHTKNRIVKEVQVATINHSKQLLLIYILGIATGVGVITVLNF